MKIALARAETGLTSLGEAPSHDHAPVDQLHACAAARRESWLASFGADLIRLKISNCADAYPVCLAALVLHLSGKQSLKLKPNWVNQVAEQALKEHIVDFCPVCGGRGQTEDKAKSDGREGAVPMVECVACKGFRFRRYTKGERLGYIGEAGRMDAAFDEAHYLMSEAIRALMWRHGNLMR